MIQQKQTYRAVIVDDEPFVLDGLRAAIDWEGFNFEIVYSSTNPVSVLTYLKNNPVDLLITDISMPQMSGLELIRLAKAANPLMMILVLSAYDNFEYVRTALRNGAENYLLKPLDPDELSDSISTISEHLAERTQISHTYGSTMLTFRSHFVEAWVKGAFNTEDFMTRAELLGINLALSNYTVLLFSSISADADAMSVLFDKLLSAMVGRFQSHFYFESTHCLVCILSDLKGSFNREEFLTSVDRQRPGIPCTFFVSAGHTVDNYEDVSESYRNAHRYLFLRHTIMTSYLCSASPLSFPVRSIIEQDFSEISEEDYLCGLSSVLTASLSNRERMELQLAVLNHGLFQTETACENESVVEKLREICCNTSNYVALMAYLKSFVHLCYQVLTSNKEEQTGNYPYVETVIQAIHNFSNKDISLKTLAAQLNMHPSYLGNIFRQQTGYYFNDYLNEERLKYAAHLMSTTSLKLKDIVERAGFSSQTYFNRLFKRRFGMSPLSYRRESQSKKTV